MAERVIVGFDNPADADRALTEPACLSPVHDPSPGDGIEGAGVMAAQPTPSP